LFTCREFRLIGEPGQFDHIRSARYPIGRWSELMIAKLPTNVGRDPDHLTICENGTYGGRQGV